MKNTLSILFATLLLVACGGGTDEIAAKKEELNGLKDQQSEIKKQITALEAEIREAEPDFGKKRINAVLVTSKTIVPEFFEHKVDVRGSIQSRTNVTVSAEVPGKIKRVNVKEGNYVEKGQLLFKLDDEIIANNVAELVTALELAKIVADKQENLYKKNVGTEIQYLQAKNNKESLERRLATAKSQMRQAWVRAPFSGSVDRVDAKVGEMAQPGQPLVRIVNPNDVHVSADISERFIGKFKKGEKVDIYFPTIDKSISSTISSVGKVINAENRTFEIEISLPRLAFPVRPNQVVVLNLQDYSSDVAFKVPTKVIQRDNRGMYVYQLVKEEDRTIAKKVYVEPGMSFNNETEIVSGLQLNQVIAMKGYRELAEGVVVEIQSEDVGPVAKNTSAQ